MDVTPREGIDYTLNSNVMERERSVAARVIIVLSQVHLRIRTTTAIILGERFSILGNVFIGQNLRCFVAFYRFCPIYALVWFLLMYNRTITL